MPGLEIEAKLIAPDRATLDRIALRRTLAGLELVPAPEERLVTRYLDTPGRALALAKVALRVRETPHGVEMTVKSGGSAVGAVHRRREQTLVLAALPNFPLAAGDPHVASLLPGILLDGPLAPYLKTWIFRRAIDLKHPGESDAVAELALDRVRFAVPAGGSSVQSEETYEVEIELKGDGTEKDLPALVAELLGAYQLEPARLSKLERGLRWLDGAGSSSR